MYLTSDGYNWCLKCTPKNTIFEPCSLGRIDGALWSPQGIFQALKTITTKERPENSYWKRRVSMVLEWNMAIFK